MNYEYTVSVSGISKTTTHTVGASINLDETIATGETNKQVSLNIRLSGLAVFYLVADKTVTVKTNSSSTPQETFNLNANKPIAWQTGAGTAPIAGDVTNLFVTNASGSSALIQLIAGWDPTP